MTVRLAVAHIVTVGVRVGDWEMAEEPEAEAVTLAELDALGKEDALLDGL